MTNDFETEEVDSGLRKEDFDSLGEDKVHIIVVEVLKVLVLCFGSREGTESLKFKDSLKKNFRLKLENQGIKDVITPLQIFSNLVEIVLGREEDVPTETISVSAVSDLIKEEISTLGGGGNTVTSMVKPDGRVVNIVELSVEE